MRHVPYEEGKRFVGTARFASVNTHLGILQSRRDDLEALGYMLLYFMRGSLPWQGLQPPVQNGPMKYEKIMDMKMDTPPEVLCKGDPPEFAAYLRHCRALGYEEEPDYGHLRKLMTTLLSRRTAG